MCETSPSSAAPPSRECAGPFDRTGRNADARALKARRSLRPFLAKGFFMSRRDTTESPMSNCLITSAVPYVNGVKHLANLAGSLLPADIHARFRRQTGHDVLFLCGTDEHGTPVELAAGATGLPLCGYCGRQHAVQADIYRRFGLSF